MHTWQLNTKVERVFRDIKAWAAKSSSCSSSPGSDVAHRSRGLGRGEAYRSIRGNSFRVGKNSDCTQGAEHERHPRT